MSSGNTLEELRKIVDEENRYTLDQIQKALDRGEKRYAWLKREKKETEAVLGSMDRNDSDRPTLEKGLIEMQQEMMELEEIRIRLEAEYDIAAGTVQETRQQKKFNKYNCFKNIRTLLDEKGVKIGDIERASGNTPGYMSRLEKESNNTEPSVEFIVNAADMLGVRIDDLISGHFKELSPNEIALLKFLNKLVKNTKDDTQDWEVETYDEHIKYADWYAGNDHPHPLYSLDMEDDETGSYPSGYSYHSRFYPRRNIEVAGMCYHAELVGLGEMIYIMNCEESGPDVKQSLPFYEVYHIDRMGTIHPVCCTREERNQIEMAVDHLYGQIQESLAHVRLSEETKSMMSRYDG